MARPRIHDAELRTRLLEAAAETVARHGVDSLSLRKLAAAQGTSTTAIYSLFGGRA
ncbi:MAG: TetR family transcriptional regulator, partial [Rhodococcus sp. (in: high G+C Gram-positive bacteria)]